VQAEERLEGLRGFWTAAALEPRGPGGRHRGRRRARVSFIVSLVAWGPGSRGRAGRSQCAHRHRLGAAGRGIGGDWGRGWAGLHFGEAEGMGLSSWWPRRFLWSHRWHGRMGGLFHGRGSMAVFLRDPALAEKCAIMFCRSRCQDLGVGGRHGTSDGRMHAAVFHFSAPKLPRFAGAAGCFPP